jgi:hypothetical protein
LHLPKITAGKDPSPFKGILDVSVTAQKLRREI